jgi:hypothetical protein
MNTRTQLNKAQANVNDMQTQLETAKRQLNEAQQEKRALNEQLQTKDREVILLACAYIMHTTLDATHTTHR